MTSILIYSNGQKMSKRLKNYPDPMNVVKDYGADALRLYLVNSPVVRAESLRLVGGASQSYILYIQLNTLHYKTIDLEYSCVVMFDVSKVAERSVIYFNPLGSRRKGLKMW